MNKRTLLILTAVVALLAIAGTTYALKLRRNLVTLDVREMEVREVVAKLKRQTGEDIFVSQDVQGKVTMNVKNAPLDGVLELVAGQVSARSSHIFPIYKNSDSLKNLHALVQRPASNYVQATTWTNFAQRRGFGGRGFGGGGFGGFGGFDGENQNTNNGAVTLQLVNKEPASAARALSMATRSTVVVDDSLQKPVTLKLNNTEQKEALQKFASAMKAKSGEFYLLQGRTGFRPQRQDNEGEDEEARRARMEARFQEMPADMRARLEEMRNMTPEERQARMQARMEDPTVQARMAERTINSIRNSTPEQMIQQARQRRGGRGRGEGGPREGRQPGQPGQRPEQQPQNPTPTQPIPPQQ
jgi:hypothetical protein